ncbi:MAG TPA: cytochrome P460 family protein [Pyrinomonadaceae bacterium]|nr:cytochrome P460 family protein [Pyrinomonadaceae bacterium]
MPLPVGDGLRILSGNGITRVIFPPQGANNPPREEKPSHASSFGVVYANDIARADLAKRAPTLRPGAVLVREKLADPNSQTPELLTVMIKRARGFNPRAADWEFLLVNGAGDEIKTREKTGSCYECHRVHEANDFVFGAYKP